MFVVYVFCLLLSGGLLGAAVFADFLDLDVADVDTDVDVDVDADLEVETETDIQAFKIFSIRGLLYTLLGFGLVGTALSLLWGGANAGLTAAVAGASGVVSGYLATAIFSWLKRSDSGARLEESSFVGLMGRMTVPFSAGGTGQVRVERGDRFYDLLAVPYERGVGDASEWRSVIVVEMKDGRALVVPENEGLLLDEGSPEPPEQR